MAKLIYSVIASANGYVEDADGNFGCAEPGEEVFRARSRVRGSIWRSETR
jgi:hypothetical protein